MRSIVVKIETPCNENWDQMQKTIGNRRHCSACQKNLVDFSIMSDADIVKWFDTHQKEETCGSWDIGQLNRPLIRHTKTQPISKWQTLLSYLIVSLSFLFPKTSNAVAKSITSLTEQTPINDFDSSKTVQRTSIKGHLSYADNKNAIGVTVKIADTEFETLTDSLGNFEFEIYAGMHIPSLKFIFSSNDLMETTQNIKDFNTNNRQYFKLDSEAPNSRRMTGITVHSNIGPIKDERPLLERLWMKGNW